MVENTEKNGKYYRLLSRNMVLVIVVVSLAPLLLTGGVMLAHFRDAYQQKVRQHLGELTQKHSQNIDRFLIDRLADIRVLARSYDLGELSDVDFLSRRLRILREEYGGHFVDLGLVDSLGVQEAYAGPFNLTGALYADADWFNQTITSEDHISDVFTGLRGSPHFIVGVKTRWEGSDFILRATIDFMAFNSLVENIRIGETGFAFILNRKGQFQTNPRFEALNTMGPCLEVIAGLGQGEKYKVAEKIDDKGQAWLISVAALKGGQWFLCCQQKTDEAFSALDRAFRVALLVFLVGGLAIFTVAVFISRRMVNRIAAANEEKAVMNDKIIETGRLASIGELAAGIAHEINNPVAIMVEEAGWIEDLLNDENPAADNNLGELRRAVGQIRTQGGRCKEITHKLLSFARKTDPRQVDVNLNEIVSDTISLLKQKTRYANVKIEAELDPDLPFVSASPSELQQVMVNLVNNAVDAIGSAGGQVTLDTTSDDGQVILIVKDTGKGIPEAVLAKIFDPFFTTKPVGQGTGLGLSICFGIIHKMGGDISVDSQVGLGTVFTVKLPAKFHTPGPGVAVNKQEG
ncbi:MAG: ATP-binding protein [Pseudomonadota bacterium]